MTDFAFGFKIYVRWQNFVNIKKKLHPEIRKDLINS